MKDCCDLHTHTTASDGSDTPYELVKKAKEAGLSGIAVTDHDTLAGIKEAMEAGDELGIEVIPGVELSVLSPQGNMHMLGYFIDTESAVLREVLEKVQEARARRNPMILEKLVGMGRSVTMDELREIARGGQVGRPHIARAMLERGYVKTVGEAFARFLRNGGPAYVPKSILKPAEAIRAVHSARGLSVLAHPVTLGCNEEELDALLSQLKENGLDGIECYYTEHSKPFTQLCLKLAEKYRLLPTGGSDYHGEAKPHVKLGKGKGNLCVPRACLDALKSAAGN